MWCWRGCGINQTPAVLSCPAPDPRPSPLNSTSHSLSRPSSLLHLHLPLPLHSTPWLSPPTLLFPNSFLLPHTPLVIHSPLLPYSLTRLIFLCLPLTPLPLSHLSHPLCAPLVSLLVRTTSPYLTSLLLQRNSALLSSNVSLLLSSLYLHFLSTSLLPSSAPSCPAPL